MKLHFAVVHLGKCQMDVVADDRDGHRRMVNIRWLAREKTNTPPVFWPESVEGEHEISIERERDEAAGKVVGVVK